MTSQKLRCASWFLPTALILLMLVLAGGATASAQVVNNDADFGPGSLRSAIANAYNGEVITFGPNMTGAFIALHSTLTINTNLTIDASALPGGIVIYGDRDYVQIFNVASTATVFLKSLTITNGIASGGTGGGIHNDGNLTLNQCTVSGNSAPEGIGGGIFSNDGNLTLNPMHRVRK